MKGEAKFLLKFKKKMGGIGGSGRGGGSCWGLRVDVYEELKFLRKPFFLGGGGGGVRLKGVRVDVNKLKFL